jgi:phosphatidylglycerol:prolipoprotein diacylglycerol transferase
MQVHFDPILIEFGPFRISWYGLMYVFGFLASYILVRYQIKKKDFGISREEVDDLYFYLIIGLFVGARLGYVLFYDFPRYLAQPLEIFAVWHGGMSFHGGLIGVVAVGILFCQRKHKSFWKIADLFVVTAPIGLGLGRIGNFINGELYGRITHVPWAMVFPAGGPYPRHPSQLYESALEGWVLFVILWTLKDRNFPPGSLLAIFLILYGIFRFFLEFFRQPDVQLGFVLGPLSLGQIFCLLMIGGGAILALVLKKRGQK